MVENRTLSLPDEIYNELRAGLQASLDWTHFLAKHSSNKGPLYDAIGRFFRDMESEVRALSEVQAKLSEARLQLRSLSQRIKEADKVIHAKTRDIVGLEEKQSTLKKQIETLESNLEQKGETLARLQELEKLDFGQKKLETLYTALAEIGSKRGLKPKEAVETFFAALKDYEAIQGFNQELQRLDTVISRKSSEAEKWKMEAETCESRYKELQAAIGAIQSLSKQGVKPAQVVSWNNSLTGVGGVEELEEGLVRYKSVQGLLAAKKREQQRLDTKLLQAGAAVKTLTEQRTELEASIKALRVSAVKEIESVSQVSVEKITGMEQEASNSIRQIGETGSAELQEVFTLVDQVTASSISSISQVGETALDQLREALFLVDQVAARALEVGKTIRQIEGKLDKSKKIKVGTEALVRRIEGDR